MKIYFAAYNPYDIIALASVGARHVSLPIWYAKKYFGKKLDRLEDFKKTFDSFGIFISEGSERDNTFLDKIEGDTDFVIDNSTMSQVGRTIKTDNDGRFIYVKRSPIGEIDDSRIIQDIKNIGVNSSTPLHLINMFSYIHALKYPYVHSISVSDWSNVAQHKHLTVFDDTRNDLDTLDFRSDREEFDFDSERLLMNRYLNKYADFCSRAEITNLDDIDRTTILKLPFVWYYMPILRYLNILDENFKLYMSYINPPDSPIPPLDNTHNIDPTIEPEEP